MRIRNTCFLACMTLSPWLVADEPASIDGKRLVEEFDGELSLDWTVLNERDEEWSLESHPGEICLATPRGSMFAENEVLLGSPPANIFLLNHAISSNANFAATIQVNKFEPTAPFQQIALLWFQSTASYVKASVEQRAGKELTRPQSIIFAPETDNVVGDRLAKNDIAVDGPFWLRMTRTGREFKALYSDDGDNFRVVHTGQWSPDAEGAAPRIGFVAKNGGDTQLSTDITVESFTIELTQ